MVEINVNFYSFAWVVVIIHMNNIVLFCVFCFHYPTRDPQERRSLIQPAGSQLHLTCLEIYIVCANQHAIVALSCHPSLRCGNQASAIRYVATQYVAMWIIPPIKEFYSQIQILTTVYSSIEVAIAKRLTDKLATLCDMEYCILYMIGLGVVSI